MKKYLLFSIMILFSGCISLGVRGEYKSCQSDFYKLVSKPFKEQERQELENQFQELRDKINRGDYSKSEKTALNKDIDYYLMVLEDLKD
ncbi:hypothetical protein [Cetobacterium sp.]|uniref:hypothetical protein n=1 Tax=Cetobacterium sp. TaxID=2071632 RepID=UPI002FCBCE95